MTILALFTLFENNNELNIPLTEQIKVKKKNKNNHTCDNGHFLPNYSDTLFEHQ